MFIKKIMHTLGGKLFKDVRSDIYMKQLFEKKEYFSFYHVAKLVSIAQSEEQQTNSSFYLPPHTLKQKELMLGGTVNKLINAFPEKVDPVQWNYEGFNPDLRHEPLTKDEVIEWIKDDGIGELSFLLPKQVDNKELYTLDEAVHLLSNVPDGRGYRHAIRSGKIKTDDIEYMRYKLTTDKIRYLLEKKYPERISSSSAFFLLDELIDFAEEHLPEPFSKLQCSSRSSTATHRIDAIFSHLS
ncbi:MAG: hypothetical protein HOI61_04785 [Gammaproteobacteria bacterium]|nr:hypothetical protein [Gammaproteobacteria bacterium]MBT3719926.1 hypothetical protein [Gammaproteobacteria bacterium]MBT3844193.1 hypothetical protein [Gammaproteobacteria bacterium]MBT3893704.1 hypothetical protein [Gammaproteobacteria bacterium]MBT4549675.1 hypothetical protein [Gammaproteobacteria bacterium]